MILYYVRNEYSRTKRFINLYLYNNIILITAGFTELHNNASLPDLRVS